MTISIGIGLITATIFAFIGLVHVYWSLGGKWGSNEAIPTTVEGKRVLNPKPWEAAAVGFGLLLFALYILAKIQVLSFSLPAWIDQYGIWLLTMIFLLRALGEFRYVGFFKRIKGTSFARLDSLLYSPLCLFLGLNCLIIALTA